MGCLINPEITSCQPRNVIHRICVCRYQGCIILDSLLSDELPLHISGWLLSSVLAVYSPALPGMGWGENALGVSSELLEFPPEKLSLGKRAKAVFLPYPGTHPACQG